ncbi:MAG: hypothetical protein KGH62_04360, partial [Candidatus Micrarchaeota archaeon]|nr:hypothetical protein [Candidatus Micrarchaeota archaeon]
QNVLVFNGISTDFASTASSPISFPGNFVAEGFVLPPTSGSAIGLGAALSQASTQGYYVTLSSQAYIARSNGGGGSIELPDQPSYGLSGNEWYTIGLAHFSNGLIVGYGTIGTNSLNLTSALTSGTDTTYTSFNSILLVPSYNPISINYSLALVRASPPNGIMPAYTFDPMLSKLLPTLSVPSNEFISTFNGTITATCLSGDACQIWKVGGASALASGTTTATLPSNSLATGYATLYANDITNGQASGTQTVKSIAIAANVLIVLKNSQGSAVTANTPLSITFNAIGYQSYESNSLNNTVLYFRNGTVAYSWIEGNAMNEQQQANTLYTSNDVLIWFKTPSSNTYLPASSSNEIYLGFATVSTNLLDGNFIGEAPQLSCSNPSLTSACVLVGGASKYGQYDNGANVFTVYQNFAGYSCPPGWTCSGSTISNSISEAYSSYAVTTSDYGLNASQILDFEGRFSLATTSANSGAGYMSSPYYNTGGQGDNWEVNDGNGDCKNSDTCAEAWSSGSGQSAVSTTATGYHVWSIYLPSSTSTTLLSDYGSQNTVTITGPGGGVNGIPDSAIPIGFSNAQGSQNTIGPFNWIRLRKYLPNGADPSASFTAVNTPFSVSISSGTLLPASLNYGQSITFNAVPSGGTGSYSSYDFLVFNSITGIVVANMLTTNNGFIYTIPSSEAGNTLVANVLVTDSGDSTANSINSSVLTVNAATSTTISTTTTGCGLYCGSGGTGVYGTTEPTSSSSSSTTISPTTISTSTTAQTTAMPLQTTLPPPPIEVSIKPVGQTTPQLCNGTTIRYSIDYLSMGATFEVLSASDSCFTITAVNVTNVITNIGNNNQTLVKAINFTTSSANVTVNATIGYPCSYPYYAVAPYILRNGTWNRITPFSVDAGTCIVSFNVPSDPVIALFENASALPSSSTTSIAQATAPGSASAQSYMVVLIALVLIVAIILIAVYLRKQRRRFK